jgi:P27 family predicted phage terminase small subunit
MGKRGTKKTPTKDKKAKGTYRADRAFVDEVEFDILSENILPPEYLNEEGKREWNRVIPQLQSRGILNQTDRSSMIAYCLEWETYIEACIDIRKEGKYQVLTNKGGSEYMAPNPNIQIRNKALANFMRIATEFGFTPSSRTRISVSGAKKNSNPDEDSLLRLSKG